MCACWFLAHSLSKTPKEKSVGVRSGNPGGPQVSGSNATDAESRIMNSVQFAVCRAGPKHERLWQTRLIILHAFKSIFIKLLRPMRGGAPKLRIIFGEILLCVEIWVYWHCISEYSSDVSCPVGPPVSPALAVCAEAATLKAAVLFYSYQ